MGAKQDSINTRSEQTRSSGIECWYSIDTGPSVFINTFQRHINAVASRLVELGFSDVIISSVGDTPKLTERHLF
jgi:mevalonate pyrophosphate decarboxylase